MGKGKRKKKPHHQPGKLEEWLKKPAAETPNPASSLIAWHTRDLDLTWDKYGWHLLTGDQLRDIHQHLRNQETRTIGEIFLTNTKRDHPIPVTDLIPEAQERLREMNLKGIDELHRLRFGNLKRVWGILEGNILRLIWYDPKHGICPSKK